MTKRTWTSLVLLTALSVLLSGCRAKSEMPTAHPISGQNWSASLFLKGTVKDLMGLDPHADRHEVTIAPQLPSAWEFAELSSVVIGDHRLDVRAERERAEIRHLSGPAPLTVRYGLIGAGPLTATLDGEPLAVEIRKMAGRDAVVVEIALSPGQTATLAWSDGVLNATTQP